MSHYPAGVTEADVSGPPLEDYRVSEDFSATVRVSRVVEAYSLEDAEEAFDKAQCDLGNHEAEQTIVELFEPCGSVEVEKV